MTDKIEIYSRTTAMIVKRLADRLRSDVAAPGFAQRPEKNKILTLLLACDRLLSALPGEYVGPVGTDANNHPEIPDSSEAR